MSVLAAATKRTYLPGDQRRAQILGCAREVFAKLGYHRASIADICAAAGIGRGTLYQYFDNKQDVFSAVVDELSARVREVIDTRPPLAAVPGTEDAPPALIARFCEMRLRVLLDAVFADEASLRLVLREARGIDGGIDQVISRIDGITLGALTDDLTTAARLGIIDCPEPALTAEFVLGGVQKMVLRALEQDQPVDLDAIVRVAIKIQLFGLLSSGRRKGK
jgi:AcrR family transcriptional regulator